MLDDCFSKRQIRFFCSSAFIYFFRIQFTRTDDERLPARVWKFVSRELLLYHIQEVASSKDPVIVRPSLKHNRWWTGREEPSGGGGPRWLITSDDRERHVYSPRWLQWRYSGVRHRPAASRSGARVCYQSNSALRCYSDTSGPGGRHWSGGAETTGPFGGGFIAGERVQRIFPEHYLRRF